MSLTNLQAQSHINKALFTFLNSDLYLNSTESRVYRMKEKIVPGGVNIALVLSSRMRTTAGRAGYNKKNGKLCIKLNRPLLSLQKDEEIYDTCSHELAHCVDYLLRGKMDHKWLWKKIHEAMGGSSSRCHDYDTSSLVRRHYVRDTLNNKILTMTTRSANKILKHPDWYCHQYQYIGEAKTVS